MRCTVIVVSYNTKDILSTCLDHLFASNVAAAGELEVIVVDNASPDGSAGVVKERYPQVTLVASDWNMGFARANNHALHMSSGEYVVLLNPDAFVEKEAISNAIAFLEARPDAAACGGLIMDGEGGQAPSARRFPSAYAKFCRMWGLADRFAGSSLFDRHDYRNADLSRPIQVDWVPGTFTVIKREALRGLPLFDERFFMYYEETDFCLRLQKEGQKIWFVPGVRVTHLGGASAKTVKKDFDSSGSQVAGWRLRSEYLYFRKNFGALTMWVHAGIEISRHWVRIGVNSLRGDEVSLQKVADSRRKISLCTGALKDTRYGTFSPEAPWT